MTVETWPIARIKPYERNARKIPQSAVDKVALSLRTFGWRQPIVVDQAGVIVVGHVRRLGALQNGYTDAPVHVADGLTPEQIKAYRLMDNRSHEETTWDLGLLGPELTDLKGFNLDLSLTGFDANELSRLLPQDYVEPEPQLERADELQAKWQVERGQVWQIGEHRLMCGDATVADDVALLLRDEVPGIMVTDPPYGVEYDPSWRNGRGGFSDDPVIQTGLVTNDDTADWTSAWRLFPGDVAYVWHASLHTAAVMDSLLRAGFEHRAQLIWRKQQALMSRGAYHWQHEPCWYVVKKGRTSHWAGDRTQSTVWDIQNLNPTGNRTEAKLGHGAQKPVECMRRPIKNHEIHEVYDPFAGTGTTAVAAENLKRRCYGMEIEPKYCAVTLERMADMGLQPKPVA